MRIGRRGEGKGRVVANMTRKNLGSELCLVGMVRNWNFPLKEIESHQNMY